MSVTVRPYRRGGWEVDVWCRTPDGRRKRERKRLSVTSKTAAQRWGEARERQLLVHGPTKPHKEVPTLKDFVDTFLDGHVRANRQKPSGLANKRSILKVHLVPFLGTKKLDAITTEDVQRLRSRLEKKSAKTVNNVISVLNTALKKAVEWGVMAQMPCTVRLLPVPRQEASFFDFDQYERLVTVAKANDRRTYLLVLLGAEAGLRCGEMMALEWSDVDLAKRQLYVRHSIWKGQTTVPKGGRLRFVPLTVRLATALREHRHLRGRYVLCTEKGEPLTQKIVQDDVRRAERRAGLDKLGVHILRHTFCSHLAMRGAPARAIQELAGHQDLTTTQRYMHLSPAAIENAIRLLDHPAPGPACGDIVETAGR